MPTIQECFDAVLSELDYQDRETVNPDRPDMIPNLAPGDIILAMEHCLAEARAAWYRGSAPHPEASTYVRKVTALGFRFMMNHRALIRATNKETPE